MKNKLTPHFLFVAATILTAGLWRIFVSAGMITFSNFTPLGASALFGGCYFTNKRTAFIIPLVTLWLSDLVIDYLYYHQLVFFYEGWFLSYAAFAIAVYLGSTIKQVKPTAVLLFSVAGSLIHWILTNFGVWASGLLYPKTGLGILECYTAALPFLKNTLEIDIVFGLLFFGSFEWAKRRFPALAAA